jgi:hypothetical protein
METGQGRTGIAGEKSQQIAMDRHYGKAARTRNKMQYVCPQRRKEDPFQGVCPTSFWLRDSLGSRLEFALHSRFVVSS